MKKLVLLTLALLCLCLCTSCNSSVSEAVDCGFSFEPKVEKYLGQTSIIDMTSPTNIDEYYWTYSYDKIIGNEIETTEYKPFYPAAEDSSKSSAKGFKNLSELDGFSRGVEEYIFSVKGYVDSDLQYCIWEGTASRSVRLVTSKVMVVPICLECRGTGRLYFDISATPIVDKTLYDDGDDVKIEFDESQDYKLDYFVLTYDEFSNTIAIKNKKEETTVTVTEVTSSVKTTNLNATYDKVTENYYYKDETPLLELEAGAYLFTIQQMTWDYEREKYVSIPTRKQVMFVSIFPESDNYISGALDANISVKNEIVQHDFSSKELLTDVKAEELTETKNGYNNPVLYTPFFEETEDDKVETKYVTWLVNGNTIDTSVLGIDDGEEADSSSRATKSYIVGTNGDSSVAKSVKFYRHESDESTYLLTCIYNPDSDKAESVTIKLEAD